MSSVIPLKHIVVGGVERSLMIFAGAVAFVLLIGCANVANLLLMRASTRQQEISIRAALGAERPRLVRQLLTESLVLAFAGGLLGLAVAAVGVRLLLAMAPAGLLPRVSEIHLDGTVLAVTALVCAAAGIGFGIVPALHATRRELRPSLGVGRGGGGVERTRLRGILVTAECALAVVLLVGAGLLKLRSFQHLRSVDLGFRPDNVVAFTVDLPSDRLRDDCLDARIPTADESEAFLARLLSATDAAVIDWRPLSQCARSGGSATSSWPTGASCSGWISRPQASSITPDYFRVMGIRLRKAGRAFTERDDLAASGVAIISRIVAERLWPARRWPSDSGSAWSDEPKIGEIGSIRSSASWTTSDSSTSSHRCPPSTCRWRKRRGRSC